MIIWENRAQATRMVSTSYWVLFRRMHLSLQRMGEMCDAEGDKSQAFQYHYDVSNPIVKDRSSL